MIHSSDYLALVDEVRVCVKEVTASDALHRFNTKPDLVLIDVREDREWIEAHAVNAIHLGKGIIERDIHLIVPDKSKELILYCGGGYRSVLAADNLQKMGYSNVFSMAGGWKAWKEAGGKTEPGVLTTLQGRK